MYQLYMFNDEGRYHAPVYVESDELVLSTVFRYIDVVPRIVVTKMDESVLEAEGGNVIFPAFDAGTQATVRSSVEPIPKNLTIDVLMTAYMGLTSDYADSHGKDENVYRSMVNVENDLFALAARDNVNLSSLGWKNSGIIQAELEVYT